MDVLWGWERRGLNLMNRSHRVRKETMNNGKWKTAGLILRIDSLLQETRALQLNARKIVLEMVKIPQPSQPSSTGPTFILSINNFSSTPTVGCRACLASPAEPASTFRVFNFWPRTSGQCRSLEVVIIIMIRPGVHWLPQDGSLRERYSRVFT